MRVTDDGFVALETGGSIPFGEKYRLYNETGRTMRIRLEIEFGIEPEIYRLERDPANPDTARGRAYKTADDVDLWRV